MNLLAGAVLLTQTAFYLGASSRKAKASERNVALMTTALFISSTAAVGLAAAVIWRGRS